MDNTTSERWFCFNSLDKKTLSFCNLRGILSRNISIKYVENWLNTYSLILLCSSQINIVSLLILGILPTSKILFGTAVCWMDSGFMVSWNENQKVARKLIFSCICLSFNKHNIILKIEMFTNKAIFVSNFLPLIFSSRSLIWTHTFKVFAKVTTPYVYLDQCIYKVP